MLTLILGGARSGKSRLAQQMAQPSRRVTYVATAQDGDDPEMAERIALHRSQRPSSWRTIEAPLALADAIHQASRDSDAILVDCLTVWLSNLFYEYRSGPASDIETVAQSELARIAETASASRIILVSNEVGSGTVPESALTRAFRDAQGRLNQFAAAAAQEVILSVAGLPLFLKRLENSK